MTARLRKFNGNLTNKQDQYKEALCTLNKEVKELKEKLEEKGRRKKKEQEVKATVEKELIVLLGQVEIARAHTVNEFKASQPFIDSCVVYYGDRFEDCLKQIKSIYLHLDLSKVTMDDPLPSTLANDIIFEEADESTQSTQDPKDDSVVLAQFATDPPVTLLIPSAELPNVENLLAQEVQDPFSKNDENPQDAPAS